MGAEFSQWISEHDVTLVAPVDVESVRRHLPEALERLGYRVLSEQPLQARRKARGWGMWSSNLLDQRTTVVINLKPAGEHATRLTFDYTIDNPILTRGDLQTLERETEAVVALVKSRTASAACPACGTEAIADSRFCRKCGSSLTMTESSELDVLRLTAGARGAHQTLVSGAVMLMLVCLCLLSLPFISSSKWENLLMGAGGFLSIVGWITMLFGLRRLHRTLNPAGEDKTLPVESRRAVTAPQTAALPPQHVPASVTEATTDLLTPASESSTESAHRRDRQVIS
jgi:predicted RNA-binding Zn-ribbon protein involved in translation (DUF1610 family)